MTEKSRFQVAKVDYVNEALAADEEESSATGPHCLVTSASASPTELANYGTVYDTVNVKSLLQYTHEALPRVDHYRNVMSVHGHISRPTLDELHYSGRGSVAGLTQVSVAWGRSLNLPLYIEHYRRRRKRLVFRAGSFLFLKRLRGGKATRTTVCHSILQGNAIVFERVLGYSKLAQKCAFSSVFFFVLSRSQDGRTRERSFCRNVLLLLFFYSRSSRRRKFQSRN